MAPHTSSCQPKSSILWSVGHSRSKLCPARNTFALNDVYHVENTSDIYQWHTRHMAAPLKGTLTWDCALRHKCTGRCRSMERVEFTKHLEAAAVLNYYSRAKAALFIFVSTSVQFLQLVFFHEQNASLNFDFRSLSIIRGRRVNCTHRALDASGMTCCNRRKGLGASLWRPCRHGFSPVSQPFDSSSRIKGMII